VQQRSEKKMHDVSELMQWLTEICRTGCSSSL